MAGVREGEAEGAGKGMGERKRGDEEIDGCEEGAEDVLGGHHLRAGVGFVARGGEDVVLGGVGEAVEEEVDG